MLTLQPLEPIVLARFRLDGGITPKARPRVTSHGTYMPPAYQHWKSEAIAVLKSQAARQNLKTLPIRSCSVEIELLGKHHRKGDLDNIAGAILDALTQGGILIDDSMMVVSSLSIKLSWNAIADPVAFVTLFQG